MLLPTGVSTTMQQEEASHLLAETDDKAVLSKNQFLAGFSIIAGTD